MTNTSRTRKSPKQEQHKARKRLHALSGLYGVFRILSKSVLRKIGKGRVKRIACPKRSKACAGNTCTPCEGVAPPSTLHAFGNAHTRRGAHE